MFLVARPSKSVFNLPSHARRRARVKSSSTWSSRFIRSTIITYFLVAPDVKRLYERLGVAEMREPSCGCRTLHGALSSPTVDVRLYDR